MKHKYRTTTEILDQIVELIKKHPEGLTITIISKELNISWNKIKEYLSFLCQKKLIISENLGKRTLYKSCGED